MRFIKFLLVAGMFVGCTAIVRSGSIIQNECVNVTVWPEVSLDSGISGGVGEIGLAAKVVTDWPMPCSTTKKDAS